MNLKISTNPRADRFLKKQLYWLAAGCISSAAVLSILLAHLSRSLYPYRWFLMTLVGMVVLFGFLWRNIGKNRVDEQSPLLPEFGAGTVLSMLRGSLLAVLFGLLVIPPLHGWAAWIPGLIFLVAVIADFFDGYLARVQGILTELGQWLDINLDGAAILIGCLVAVHFGNLPIWYLPVGFARYVFVVGIWLRQRRSLLILELPESSRRRGLAGAQMIFIAVIMLPFFSPPATSYAAAAFMAVFLGSFLYDWLLVAGIWIPNRHTNAEHFRRRAEFVLPFVFRFGCAALLAIAALSTILARGLDPFAGPIAFVEICLAGLLLAGVAGRLVGLGVLLLVGLLQMKAPLDLIQVLLIFSASLVFFTGTGARSLWSPEAQLAEYRAGRRSTHQTES